ncbi:MBL fold metallo-hydrolase [Clostridium gasigenes]|uniref:ComEC/Rec2 family competence protein n=1 Tax=Clostridium gasigenes TaxID=94869 RepID=UPI00162768ED|nr:MBL fold metallo-hydrolase [Clostridium gasigenes]MBB6624816.1 MBL fold metallo-hydrolase [Clostridium gasigenes]
MNKVIREINKKVYFVNEIISLEEKEESLVILFEVDKNENVNAEEVYINKYELVNEKIIEGRFVYRIDGKLINASKNKISKIEIFKNNMYRGKLIKRYTKSDSNINNITEVYSYHINVGHGNCSIIVIKYNSDYKIWVVDCSKFDFKNKIMYIQNIERCFDHIKKKFNLNDIKIEKLLITHPHYDHINGIDYLISNGYVKDTEVWINLYYSWPDTCYSKLLERLKTLNLRLIEPKVSSSNNSIEIIYPNNTILRTDPKNVTTYPIYSVVPSNKVNNASVIYKLNLGEKSIIFPGDIEEDEWNKVLGCEKYLKNATYYCISHHGSITGHSRSICPYKSTTIDSIDFCCSNTKKNILMGRDNAYPGIFSEVVLESFKGRLYRTDLSDTGKVPRFMELDWEKDNVLYY